MMLWITYPCHRMNHEDQRILGEIKLTILEEQRVLLCKCLKPDRHFPYLRSVAILNREDCEEIEAERTTTQRANRFLDLLVSKGPSGYDHLCEALMIDQTQMHVLETLNTQYEDKKNRYLALLRQHGPEMRTGYYRERHSGQRPTSSDA